jgi:hypothetical protein
MTNKTLISGQFIDKLGRKYFLALEPAISLGDGHYLIQREHTIEVWSFAN